MLDATPAGLPLYRGLGFEETWSYRRLVAARPGNRSAKPRHHLTASTVRPIADADWAALCAYDATAFGADRSALLQRMRGRLPAADLVAERDGRILGFSLGRNGRSAAQIGPITAEGDAVALALLGCALPAIAGPIYLDFADAKSGAGQWLAGCGFTAQRPLTRMLSIAPQGFDDTTRTFAVVGPEFGWK